MPLDGHAHLVSQGWSGKGNGLRHGAIAKPVTVIQKKSLAGIGKDRDEAFPFWDHVFQAAAVSISVKVHNSDDESDSEQSSTQALSLKRTSTGIISNRRPTSGTPALSGTTTPSESQASGSGSTTPRLSIMAAAKQQAARRMLYSMFYRGLVLTNEEVADEEAGGAAGPSSATSPTPSSMKDVRKDRKKGKKRKADVEESEEKQERKRRKREAKAKERTGERPDAKALSSDDSAEGGERFDEGVDPNSKAAKAARKAERAERRRRKEERRARKEERRKRKLGHETAQEQSINADDEDEEGEPRPSCQTDIVMQPPKNDPSYSPPKKKKVKKS